MQCLCWSFMRFIWAGFVVARSGMELRSVGAKPGRLKWNFFVHTATASRLTIFTLNEIRSSNFHRLFSRFSRTSAVLDLRQCKKQCTIQKMIVTLRITFSLHFLFSSAAASSAFKINSDLHTINVRHRLDVEGKSEHASWRYEKLCSGGQEAKRRH